MNNDDLYTEPITTTEQENKMKMSGVAFEKFLGDFAGMMISSVPPGMDPSLVQGFRALVMEIARHHLAGFSQKQIVDEFATLAGSRDKCERIYPGIIAQLENVTLTDPKTGKEFTPEPADVHGLFNLSHNHSIEMVRFAAIAVPLDAFVKGDYETCAILGEDGATAFGRHMFYQMSAIGYSRLAETEKTKSSAFAAKLGLSSEPWFLRLVALSLGIAKPSDLQPLAKNSELIWQLTCFTGLRAFTSGDKTLARQLLTECKAHPADLVAEVMLVDADLQRC